MPNPKTGNVQRNDATAGTNLGGGGGLRQGGAGNGSQMGGGNSRSNLGTQGGGRARSNRRTMLTAETTSFNEAEIDPETGEVLRFDPNPKKRKKTVMDLDGTPTLDELRASGKSLLGY